MQVYSLLYKSNSNLKAYIQNNQLKKNKYLIVIHSDELLRGDMEKLVASLRELMPSSEIVGCSVGGVIYKGKSLEHKTLISFIDDYHMEMVSASASLLENGKYKTPDRLADEIEKQLGGIDDSFLLAFYSPSYPYPSQLVQAFNSRGKNFKMTGGGAYSAANDLSIAKSYIIHNGKVAEDSLVVGKLKGHLLFHTQVTTTGIKSIGRTYSATKSDGHRLIEVDGKPAKKWFNHLVGEENLADNQNIIHALPIVRKRDERLGLNIVYGNDPFTGAPLGDDLFLFDAVAEGEQITAGYIDPNLSKEKMKEFCDAIDGAPSEALFAYSCMTRRFILHNCAQWELQPFMATPITGAFMAGELIWDGERCNYSNSAFTVASLSEDPKATVNLNISVLDERNDIQFDNLTLVNYLFSTANSELKKEITESQQKFANQLIYDADSGLPNLTKFVYDNEAKKFNAVCLLSLKNESIIKVFLDKKLYLSYIRNMVEGCKKALGESCNVYLYNELSVLIAENVQDREKFVEKIKELKSVLYTLKYDNYEPIFEMSIAFGDEDILKRAEKAHLNLHKSNEDILVYYDEESVSDFNRELQMLKIINDAISYRRVIPYYQGIYNNSDNYIEICEALMRIADANGKIYYPNEFLPVAKEYQLYDRLSKIMIESVFEEADEHEFSVSINLNVRDIYNHDLLNTIFSNLESTAHPERFIFEIVEGEEITDYDYLREFTNKIHSYGGKIAIDDFGSGYSNLLHVLKIDIDYLKITGEIIKELCQDDSCQDFVSMLANWANTRDKKVIAEYVENEEIQQILLKHNVSYSQGYLFSKPHKLK